MNAAVACSGVACKGVCRRCHQHITCIGLFARRSSSRMGSFEVGAAWCRAAQHGRVSSGPWVSSAACPAGYTVPKDSQAKYKSKQRRYALRCGCFRPCKHGVVDGPQAHVDRACPVLFRTIHAPRPALTYPFDQDLTTATTGAACPVLCLQAGQGGAHNQVRRSGSRGCCCSSGCQVKRGVINSSSSRHACR